MYSQFLLRQHLAILTKNHLAISGKQKTVAFCQQFLNFEILKMLSCFGCEIFMISICLGFGLVFDLLLQCFDTYLTQ